MKFRLILALAVIALVGLEFRDAPAINVPNKSYIPITWVPGINPNNIPIFRSDGVATVVKIVCRPEVAAGGTATITVVKAASGTALSAGTALHSGTCNANGTAVTDQTLSLVGGATDVLAAGDTVGITTTGTTIWTSSGVADGVVTVYIQ